MGTDIITASANTAYAEHWNGTGWTFVAATHPGTGDSFDGGGAIPGTKNAWAVGGLNISGKTGEPFTEILHC
jgi:hypothetical protein